MSAAEPVRHDLQVNDLSLSILELGGEHADAPCVVMLHGLRDSAWSLLPVAQILHQPSKTFPGYRVLLPELRGHGRSSRSQAYAMPNFLLDLHGVVSELAGPRCALFGHSLGGHIVSKYAALFPETITAMLIVEGLGPPRRPHEGDPVLELKAYREQLLSRLAPRSSKARPILSLDDVSHRLLHNNPRLQLEHAEAFAPYLVEQVGSTLHWAFDARANSVFLGSSTADNQRFWKQVKAPTCIVSGALSHEYWGSQMADAGFSGHFAEGEMEARAANFPRHEHHWFEQSGHMVHYDEPQRLGTLCRQFLEQHHV